MYCGSCGAALTPGGSFCGRCGAPVQNQAPAAPAEEFSAEATIVRPTQPAAPAAPPAYIPPPAAAPPAYTPPPAAATPPAYTPPPAQPQPVMPPPIAGYPSAPVAPKAPNASVLATQQQLVNVLAWDWKGPLRVAGSMLGVSFIMSLIFAFMTKPSGTNFSARTMLTYIASYWNGTFGADVTGGGNGSSFGAGATPLTLTVVTLMVGIMVFRNATRNYASGISAILFAVRAALFTVLPLLIVSWAITMGSSDISKYGSSTSDHSWSSLGLQFFGSDTPGFWGGSSATSIGVSSTATFFFTLLLVVLTLSSVVLLRADWFAVGVVAKVRAYLVAPLRAFGWLMLAVTVVGLVFNIFVLAAQAIDHHSIVPAGGGQHLKFQDWITLIGLLIAYSANAGLQAVGLGSAVQFGSFTSGSMSGSGAPNSAHLLGYWAGGSQFDFGVWSALLIAPAVLGFVAVKTLKANGADHKASLRSVWTAPVGWLALIPIVVVFANWSLSGSSSGGESGGITAGLDSLGATFLIPLYLLIIGLLVAWFTGVLTPAHFDGIKNFAASVNQAAQANQQQGYQAAPPTYPGQPGVPPAYQPPTAAPPAYQPPTAPPAYQPPTTPGTHAAQPPTEFPPPPTA